MDGQLRRYPWSGWLVCWLFAAQLSAAPPDLIRTWQADATLHDVQLISPKVGWAIGEQGTAWKTSDGGRRWELVNSGTLATFRSVCLLTDQIGWIAGWQIQGVAELSLPVLMMTKDGGQSWEHINASQLSPLRFVRFFGLEEGLVVGEPTVENPTGVWSTSDGGKIWQTIGGPATRGWSTVSLASPELGMLADRDGNLALLAGPQLLPSKLPALKGRSIRGVALSSEHCGWLVGDGGLVMTSPSGGVVWEAPPAEMPEDIRDFADFHTVAVRENHVWIAGSPGGVVWHSADGGERWRRQPTGITTPIRKLQFLNARTGIAVGDLGIILMTQDGGDTWTISQGRGRHAALLSIHFRPDGVSLDTISRVAGEQGFRSTAWIAARPLETAGALALTERLQEAVSRCGGASAATTWSLPLDITGMEFDSERLQANWNRRTEGRLSQVLLGGLVRQIRMWRPHVVLVDQPAPEDAAGQLIFDATLHALEHAADGTRFIAQRELGGLAPWKADRVYLRLLPGNSGEVSLDPFEYLPRWQTTAHMASRDSVSLLGLTSTPGVRPQFRAIDLEGKPAPQSRGADLFSGLSLAPGGEVRRALPPIDDRNLDQQIKVGQRQRNFLAQAERAAEDDRLANQMLAQLADATAGMSPEQAAATLAELWDAYLQQGRGELAEAAATELLRRYPQQAAAAVPARWLFRSLVSEEMAWQKVRRAGEVIINASGQKSQKIKQVAHHTNLVKLPDQKQRLQQAHQVGRQIEQLWPLLAKSPELSLSLAALSRARGTRNHSDTIFRRWLNDTDIPDQRDWADVARRELWLVQQPPEVPDGITPCVRTNTRPQLDGVLSDECWQDAGEWRLTHNTPKTMPEGPPPLVMLAYDDEFLYLAATVTRLDGLPTDPPQTAARTHDADLRRHDRLRIMLDTDRDYQTYYVLQIDQRGWTTDACDDDVRWNPRWFVAADGDEQNWRTEVAIPWTELTAKRPEPGAAWGLGLERIAPGIGQQGWVSTAGPRILGTNLGLLRFE